LGAESLEGRQLLTAFAQAADVLPAGWNLEPTAQATAAEVLQAGDPATLLHVGSDSLATSAAAAEDDGSSVASAVEGQSQGTLLDSPDTGIRYEFLQAVANPDGSATHEDIAQPAGKVFDLGDRGRFVFDSSTSGRLVAPEGSEQKFRDVELVRDPNSLFCSPNAVCGTTLVYFPTPSDKDFIGAVQVDVVREQDGSTSYRHVLIYGMPVGDGARDPRDVDGDGSVTRADFDLIVQAVNEQAWPRPTPAGPAAGEAPLNCDVNGDGHVTPRDALLVANAIQDEIVQPASPWQNAEDPLDVNDDGFVTPLDALLVTNELDRRTISDADGRIHAQRSTAGQQQPYLDVTGDQRVTADDAAPIYKRLAEVVVLRYDELESVLSDIAADVSQSS
jgi:hypothetical protein